MALGKLNNCQIPNLVGIRETLCDMTYFRSLPTFFAKRQLACWNLNHARLGGSMVVTSYDAGKLVRTNESKARGDWSMNSDAA